MSDTFGQKVNELVNKTTRDEAGKLVLPEGLSEAEQFAVRSEIRQRDTRSAYTKDRQRIKQLEAENATLANNWEQDYVKNLTTAQQSELEELKHSDPDAWRTKITELETSAKSQYQEKRQKVTEEATFASEEERRAQVFADFQTANPDLVINDEVIDNDIPPRYTKQLEKGEVTFEEYLDNVKNYLETGKVVQGTEAPKEPNLNKVGGGATPAEAAVSADAANSYQDEIF